MGGLASAVWDVASTDTAYTAAARFAVVLAFAATGEWVAERAGTLNISVEAMILAGAFAATMGYHTTGSVTVGLALGAPSVLAGEEHHVVLLDRHGLDLGPTFAAGTDDIYFVDWHIGYSSRLSAKISRTSLTCFSESSPLAWTPSSII